MVGYEIGSTISLRGIITSKPRMIKVSISLFQLPPASLRPTRLVALQISPTQYLSLLKQLPPHLPQLPSYRPHRLVIPFPLPHPLLRKRVQMAPRRRRVLLVHTPNAPAAWSIYSIHSLHPCVSHCSAVA